MPVQLWPNGTFASSFAGQYLYEKLEVHIAAILDEYNAGYTEMLDDIMEAITQETSHAIQQAGQRPGLSSTCPD